MRKRIVLLTSTLLFLFSAPLSIRAETQNGGFQTGMISYKVNYNYNFEALSEIKTSVEKWNHTSSKLSLTYTNRLDSNQITLNYMTTPSINDNILGITKYYYRGDEINSYGTRSACTCYVFITSHTSPQNESSAKTRKATCTHEIGHAISLAHSDNQNDVMYKSNIKNLELSTYDKNELIKKWGK